MACEAEREESRTAFIAVVAWITASTPSRASSRASSAASADWRAASADASTAWAISAAERVALETMRSWRLGAGGDLAHGAGDLGDGAAGLVGGAGDGIRRGADRGGGRDDLADHLAQVDGHAAQRVAERVVSGLGLDVDGKVAVGDPLAGLLHVAQVGDHVAERLRVAPSSPAT